MSELLASALGKPAIGSDVHHRLGDQQRDDLGIGQPSPRVLRPFGQEIVGGAEHRREQQVEVGEHRGPQGSTARIGTADFDRCRYVPFPTAPQPVESLI